MYPCVLDGLLWFSDGWTLVQDQLRVSPDPTDALFTTSNGYIGLRGGTREPFGGEGLVLLSGCYETRPYAHPERTFGTPERYQTIVPVADPTVLSIMVDGIPLAAHSGTWLEHLRTLDLRTGCVTTTGRWRSPAGVTVTVRTRRMVSLDTAGVLWRTVEIEPLDDRVGTEVTLEMRANTGNRTFPGEPEALSRAWGRMLRPVASLAEGSIAGFVHATALSGRAVACVSDVCDVSDVSGTSHPVDTVVEGDLVMHRLRATVQPGSPLSVCQRAVFADGAAGESSFVLRSAADTAAAWRDVSFDDALVGQRGILDAFWEAADVEIDGAADIERAVRFSTFHVFQGAARNPERASPAKGLSGQGYEGHHLWDQEIFVGHVLSALAPEAARAALAFRCRTLPEARARAAQISCGGAQFPWRTIDGTEASAFFPAGAAQHHVNADVAWAIEHYVACTGDDGFLADGALEVLVETARLWMSIGRFDDQGRFRVDGVTGPDEYTALVNNNLYTNLMAARNLHSAADRVDALARDDPTTFAALLDAIDVEGDEPGRWRRAADGVVVPYDDVLMVHGQDDTFLGLPRWDLRTTPAEEFPLQDHHHLLNLYRHQVLKQADVVLALFLQADRFPPDQRRRDFDYYEPLASHDSSLSAPIHAVVAADVGRLDLAWRYTRDTAMTDLESRHGTLGDGLHLAAAAGAWMAVACGFGGFAVRSGVPTFRPRLPPGVGRLRFRVRFRGAVIEVDTDAAATTYRVLRGGPVTLSHDDQLVHVPPGGSRRLDRGVS